MFKIYVCSAKPGCNETFTKFVDLKKHEAAHSVDGYNCIWPGCDFATLIKTSYDVHFAKHTGEQRYICPHDDCDYKTHDPALFTRHRKRYHGYVPLARGRGAPSATGSGKTKSSSQLPAQPHPPPQLQPPGTFYQYRLQPMQPQPMQPQLMPPRPMPPRPHAIPPHPIPTPTHSIPASPAYLQPVVGSLLRPSRYCGRLHHVYRTRDGPQWVD